MEDVAKKFETAKKKVCAFVPMHVFMCTHTHVRCSESLNWSVVWIKGLIIIHMIVFFSVHLSGSITTVWTSQHHQRAGGTVRSVRPIWNAEGPERINVLFHVGFLQQHEDIQHFNNQLTHTTLKNVELLKHFKISKTAPTCFSLQGNHHQGATIST